MDKNKKLNAFLESIPHWTLNILKHRLGVENIKWPMMNCTKKKYLEKILEKYGKGEAITKIIGCKYFYESCFINTNVLDPRFESELLVEECIGIIKSNNLHSIIELGGGSGCIIISILQKCLNLYAAVVDIDILALKTLKRNIKKHSMDQKINVYHGSWFKGLPCNKKFDLLVSNPPYISSNQCLSINDPIISLDGGVHGLDCYRQILSKARAYINKYMVFEICPLNYEGLIKICYELGFSNITIKNDFNKRPRILIIKI